jgi:TRAP-type mannitol/chloroaromatic compound transport system substrate-binding protein
MLSKKMKIIKEIRLEKVREEVNPETNQRWISNARCVVRTNCYGSSLSMFKQLADVAKEAYPELKDEDIKIVQFGGQAYKRTFGIEFTPIDGKTILDGWMEIRELESTL